MDKTVGVLGGGQLGRMLAEASHPLNIPVVIADADEKAPGKQAANPGLLHSAAPGTTHVRGAFTSQEAIMELAQQVDVLTVEIEHINTAALRAVESQFATTGGRHGSGVKVFPSSHVVATIQDKYEQKVVLAKAGLALPEFAPIGGESGSMLAFADAQRQVASLMDTWATGVMLKARRQAYDGKGNYLVKTKDDIAPGLKALGAGGDEVPGDALYVEKFTPFVQEIAVMVARTEDGRESSFPAVETIQKDSICHTVFAPLRPFIADDRGLGIKQNGAHINDPVSLDAPARRLASQAIAALGTGAVGVFGVELFALADGTLLVNEIAPRPHNSGHYTQESCAPSQFTIHLLAITGLPIPPKVYLNTGAAAMLNLLGLSSDIHDFDDAIAAAMRISGVQVHLYGKLGSRKGRKLGHINVVGPTDNDVRQKIAYLDAVVHGSRSADAAASFAVPGANPDDPSLVHESSSPFPLVSIVMGSQSDLKVMIAAAGILKTLKIPHELSVVSAHRTPGRMIEFARAAEARGVRAIIAGAGGAAHLPGMIASETLLPVVGVPVKGSVLDGVDSLHSIVQMPRGVPVATVGINNSTNAALLAARIIAPAVPSVRAELAAYVDKMQDSVADAVSALDSRQWSDCV